MKYALNLSRQPFPGYRTANLALTVAALAALAALAWQGFEYLRYREPVGRLRAAEAEVRAEWDALGRRMAEIDQRLQDPTAQLQMAEVRFLGQLVERRRFSWTRLLQEIERVIPRTVYLAGLQPEIDEAGGVRVSMEARGQTVSDLSQFIGALERTASFGDVVVISEEHGTAANRSEIRMMLRATYRPSPGGE